MPIDIVRDAAIDVLLRVFERGVHLDASLDKTLRRKEVSDRGRRFMTHLVYGTVRHKRLCDHVLTKLCRQPIEELPPPIRCILRMAVFQSLFCIQVTPPSMVHTSVDLAKHRGHAGLARLTNAVLRRVPTSLDQVELPDRATRFKAWLAIRYSMPTWLVEQWLADYGEEQTEALCAASIEQAPTTIRVNALKNTPDELSEQLTKAGFVVAKQTAAPEELTVLDGPSLTRSKAFQQGRFMLQDPASMLVAHLVEPQPGDRILDLCAAPGGKTTHMAELARNEAEITAMDAQRGRLYSVRENVERLELSGIRLVCGDGTKPPLREAQFDRVLVDAPCSGLGTLRRHPDLKWHIDPAAIARLAEQQRTLLRSAVEVCKNGGLIVYSVCTISTAETEEAIRDVLADGRVAVEEGPTCLDPWKTAKGQYRSVPSEGALDGFFLTRLRRLS
jgi:16S rRNA (cytosine967-C5)-methyltransferase